MPDYGLRSGPQGQEPSPLTDQEDTENASRPTARQNVGRVRQGRASGRQRLGRSGPRSRRGCVTCKERRVKCNEALPVCGHCSRLDLDCRYVRSSSRRQRQDSFVVSQESSLEVEAQSRGATVLAADTSPEITRGTLATTSLSNGPTQSSSSVLRQLQRVQDGAFSGGVQTPKDTMQSMFASNPRFGFGRQGQYGNGMPTWTFANTADFCDIFSEMDTSWAGEASCVLPDLTSPAFGQSAEVNPFDGVSNMMQAQAGTGVPINGDTALFSGSAPTDSSYIPLDQTQEPRESQTPSSVPGSREGAAASTTEDHAHLFHLFKKIHQPPAAILIGGFERWRRLQHYLCKLSEHSRAVNHALLCVIELLMIDEMAEEEGQSRESCMKRIFERQYLACQEIERKVARKGPLKAIARESLLAAVFLLAWFEVIRDQDSQSTLFPRALADTVIKSNGPWGRYSQQLLSWLNTLDSKATHIGREHLLAPDALQIVSHFHAEIASSLQEGAEGHEQDSDDSDEASETSPHDSSNHKSPATTISTASLNLGQVKQAMLNTMLQPALAWYLTSQNYCRRISAHDKHHRKRNTPEEEWDVITSCKQIETELFELWEYRPAVISVPAEQLKAVVSVDVAKRLEEVFSTYLASFWILFVYLHRVSWWHLPHSPLAKRALSEVWGHMQRAYGEEVNGPLRKVIHPCLLWPLFLFGSECQDPEQRAWAVGQLEALGEAKPVVPREGTDATSLPPFKLSAGATRNAKRSAVLLRELTKLQDERQERIDDRDLSMKMFGCYFSIV